MNRLLALGLVEFKANLPPASQVYSHAASLGGPWAAWTTFATPWTNMYESQTTFVLTIGDMAMYMGDRWVPSDLSRSTYVWLPLNITGTTVSMPNLTSWGLNATAGTWTPAPAETEREAETNSLLYGSATILNCTGKSLRVFIIAFRHQTLTSNSPRCSWLLSARPRRLPGSTPLSRLCERPC